MDNKKSVGNDIEWIENDIKKLNKEPAVGGRIGRLIGRGSYGFVCQWKEDTVGKKVVKILDPAYLKIKNDDSEEWSKSVFSMHNDLFLNEYNTAQKTAWTKHKNLMEMCNGPQNICLDGREIIFIVMPELHTIEELEFEEERAAEQIAEIISDCCDGLHVLHKEPEKLGKRLNGMPSLVHADLKPNNIFVKDSIISGEEIRWYVIGDYSLCVDADAANQGKMVFSNEDCRNPYAAPGVIDVTSDIWSLGWIMWYWLNGKQHPQKEDIVNRKSNDKIHQSEKFKKEIELWKLFLKMTEFEPKNRIQSVDGLKAALNKAMSERAKRLELDKVRDGKKEGVVETVVLGSAVMALNYLVKEISGSKPKELHGKVNREISLSCGGTFKGIWNHNVPVKGTFTSPSGVRKTGRWDYQPEVRIFPGNRSSVAFQGLINLDGDVPDLYQGMISIKFDHGTYLEGCLENGECVEGTMHFLNGEKKTGRWHEMKGGVLCGFQYEDETEIYGCGIINFPGGVYYEGELWQGKPTVGMIYTVDYVFEHSNTKAYENIWNILNGMRVCGGEFRGVWDENGTPSLGTYVFCHGEQCSGKFQYAENKEESEGIYTGMILNGSACGYGQLILKDDRSITGEFKNGQCHGWSETVFKNTQTRFLANWDTGCAVDGEMIFADGKARRSNRWIVGKRVLASGHLFDGISFIDSDHRLSGVGKLIFHPSKYMFVGEICDDETAVGLFYDKYMRYVTEEEVK